MRLIKPRNNNGGIILQFTYSGERHSITPVPGGRFDNKEDLGNAQAIADLIMADIRVGQFDLSLARYGGLKQSQAGLDDAQERLKEIRQKQGTADFNDLWEKYKDFKAPMLAPTTLWLAKKG